MMEKDISTAHRRIMLKRKIIWCQDPEFALDLASPIQPADSTAYKKKSNSKLRKNWKTGALFAFL